MTKDMMIKKYAKVLVTLGIAVQPGETLILELDPEQYELSREITREALLAGAKDVMVYYRDPYVDKYRAQYGDRQTVGEVLPWMLDSMNVYLDAGACSLKLSSPRPYLYEDVSDTVAKTIADFTNTLRNTIRSHWGTHGPRWCIACVPNPDWAKMLFPEMEEEAALEKLWEVLMELCFVREDNVPVEDWRNYSRRCAKNAAWLNENKPKQIHFFNSTGTDFVVGFNPKAYWVGGMAGDQTGTIEYIPNLPTNEVASSPDKYALNGTVHSTRPLIYGGKIIDQFKLTFENGRVVHHEAKVGQELLTALLDLDEGSRRIGEVAFVECDVPIAKTGMVFYNTLLDENAACHMALGNGYALCIPGISWTDPAEWERENLNSAKQHIDFMFGSEDMQAVVTTWDDREVQIFKDGKFCI